MDKLLIKKQSPRQTATAIVRIEGDLYDWLNGISKDTNRSIVQVTSDIIRFAKPLIDIEK